MQKQSKKAQDTSYSVYSPRKQENIYLYTKGKEYSLNGKEYIGEYHLDNQIPKTGPKPTSNSQKLQRHYVNEDHYTYEKVKKFNVLVAKFVDPIPHRYNPNQAAYDSGFDRRYFVEKINDTESYIIEIDQQQYNDIGKPNGIDPGLFNFVAVDWKLTGRQQDILNYNEASLAAAISIIPNIQYGVRNYLEYARITLV